MPHEKRREQEPIHHADRRRDMHDYELAALERERDRAEWRLRRDKFLTAFAIVLLVAVFVAAVVTDLGDGYIIAALVAGAFGLLGLPFTLRLDERNRDE